MMQKELLAGVAIAALLIGMREAVADDAGRPDVYNMILELKAGQDRLQRENTRMRAELLTLHRQLDATDRRRRRLPSEDRTASAPVVAVSPVAPHGSVPLDGHALPYYFLPSSYGPPPGKLPAVDGLNAKVEGAGGSIAGRPAGYGAASVTTPLGDAFGLQVDGLGGALGSGTFAGGAAHLFSRDPGIGSIGVYGSLVPGFADG